MVRSRAAVGVVAFCWQAVFFLEDKEITCASGPVRALQMLQFAAVLFALNVFAMWKHCVVPSVEAAAEICLQVPFGHQGVNAATGASLARPLSWTIISVIVSSCVFLGVKLDFGLSDDDFLAQ